MTYCVGLRLDRGIVFASDTRTNAGIDNVSTFSKMHVWERRGDRVIVLMSAGNLAFTQSVVSLLNEKIDLGPEAHSLTTAATLFQAARLVGETVREVRRSEKDLIDENPSLFAASFILGGGRSRAKRRGSSRFTRRETSSRRRRTPPISRSVSTNTASPSSTGWQSPTCAWASPPSSS